MGFAAKVQYPFSRVGPKGGNPTMTTSTVTVRRKGDPQHSVEGKIQNDNNSKGVRSKSTAAVFPRGSKKRKFNNDDKHGHGQEKRRLTTLS